MGKTVESVKQEVRSLLDTYPRGVPLHEFLKTYRNMLGTKFPSREFGFTLDSDFLHSISDVVHMEMDKTGTYQLHALANKDTQHLQKLVKKQRVVKGKSNSKSKGHTTFRRPTEVAKSSVSTTRCRPFVPAVMRAEIIQTVKQYPDGIGYAPFIMAYQSMYKRAPNFSWLSTNQQERFQQLANAIPELKVKVVGGQEKLHFVCQSSPVRKPTNGEIAGKFARLQPLIAVDKSMSSSSSFKSQDLNGLTDISAIPDHMKFNIRKILKMYPEGILAVHFPILYENFTNKAFDLHELGYTSLLDLVDALPEIFIRVESPESANDWKLFHADFSDSIAGANQASFAMNGATQKHSRLSDSKEKTMVETAPPALQYIHGDLPADSTDRFFPVFISAFIHPSLFWFQLQTEEAIGNLKKLEKDMEYFYNTQVYSKYRLKDADILVGSSCVAFFADDQHWYRCVISSLLNTENVKIFLVDYGSWETIPRVHLYYLKYSFILLPSQAFQAQLALVKPPNKLGTWEINTQKRFIELCNKSFIMAQVNSMKSHVASLCLCDVGEKKEVHVNDVLISEGLAEYFPDDDSDDSMNDSSFSDNQTLEKQCLEKSSNVENDVESSHSQHTHLNKGSQTFNGNPTDILISKLKKIQLSKNRKAVRRILLGDGYLIHIIIVEEAGFVSGDDLCNLLWKGKRGDVLACRLEFKEVMIPTLCIFKEKYFDLFTQCERYEVGGFNGIDNSYSVILYPLKYSLKVLNVFGHPSSKIRETLKQEIREFNPHALVWNKSEANGEHHEELTDVRETNLDRLCVYDLKTMREGLECKRLQILASHKNKPDDENLLNKMKDIESMRSSISLRIKELEKMCLKYSEETS